MKRIQLPSFDTIAAAVRRIVGRFPWAVAFVVLQTVHALMDLYTPNDDNKHADAVGYYYLASAALLALVVHLWGEGRTGRRIRRAVMAAAQLLWLGNAAYLYTTPEPTLAEQLGNAAAVTLMALAVAGLPFWRKGSELALRAYLARAVGGGAIALVTAGLLAGGASLLLFSFDRLFGIDVPETAYQTACILCFFFYAPLLFMGSLPEGEARFEERREVQPIVRFCVRYVLNPLMAAYALTLYVYGGRILLSWELPTGWVSWLVTVLMAGIVAAVVLYLPLRTERGWRTDDFVARWFPILILPLLLLMSIGIGRRLYDYGLTVNRGYLLLFNLWCYAACAYLVVHRSRRIGWLLFSPALLFLVASVGPWNVTSTTRRIVSGEVERLLGNDALPPLPLDSAAYATALETLPGESARAVSDKLIYLENTYDEEAVRPFVTPDVDLYRTKAKRRKSNYRIAYDAGRNADFDIPAGYGRCRNVDTELYFGRDEFNKGMLTLTLDYRSGQQAAQTATFRLPMALLRKAAKDKSGTHPVTLNSTDGRARLVLSEFILYYTPVPTAASDAYGNLWVSGLLFTK